MNGLAAVSGGITILGMNIPAAIAISFLLGVLCGFMLRGRVK